MPKKQKRDNVYYEERLKNEFPAILADLKAGKHRTITDAAIAAGLKKPRTRLQELKNAFGKASRSEQSAFLGWLAAQGYLVSTTPASSISGSTIAKDRKLVPATEKRILEIMNKRGLKIGDVMAEIGYPKLNASLGLALSRGDRLQPDMIAAINKWLTANASI